MKLELFSYTPELETLIATSVLTTTSGKKPSKIYNSLLNDAEKVKRILSKLEVQHGSVLDHNIICSALEANESEVLQILLKNRYFTITHIEDSKWLISSNLRTAIRYVQKNDDDFAKELIKIISYVAPTINWEIGKGRL